MIDKVNIAQKLALFDDHWHPRIIGQVNQFDVKVVKLQGEFVWHHHDEEDELFLVIKGTLTMQFRDRDIRVEEGEFIIVPHGVEHRPIAELECHIMLFEPSGTLNTGNVRDEKTVDKLDQI